MTGLPASNLPRLHRQLAACCRGAFDRTSVSSFVVEPEAIDWPRFLATAKRHRVEPLAHVGLDRLGIVPPPEVLDRLEAQRRSIAASNLCAIDQIAELDEALGRAGIDHVWLKGLALSKLAYGDAFVKANADLDLLVGRSDLRRTADLMIDVGYEREIDGHVDKDELHRIRKSSNWSRSGDLTVDLHTRLSDNPFSSGGLSLATPRQRVEVARELKIKTFDTPYLLLHLAGHGTDCGWFRMKWACDFAAMLRQLDKEDCASMIGLSRSLGCGRAWNQAVGLSAKLFGEDFYGGMITHEPTYRDRIAWRLSLNQIRAETGPTQRPFGTIGIHLASLLKFERHRDLPGLLFHKFKLAATRS